MTADVFFQYRQNCRKSTSTDLKIAGKSLQPMKAILVNLKQLKMVLSSSHDGVCSTDLRLDTSTNGFKHVYTSLQEIC
jgi:hypothetical protein